MPVDPLLAAARAQAEAAHLQAIAAVWQSIAAFLSIAATVAIGVWTLSQTAKQQRQQQHHAQKEEDRRTERRRLYLTGINGVIYALTEKNKEIRKELNVLKQSGSRNPAQQIAALSIQSDFAHALLGRIDRPDPYPPQLAGIEAMIHTAAEWSEEWLATQDIVSELIKMVDEKLSRLSEIDARMVKYLAEFPAA